MHDCRQGAACLEEALAWDDTTGSSRTMPRAKSSFTMASANSASCIPGASDAGETQRARRQRTHMCVSAGEKKAAALLPAAARCRAATSSAGAALPARCPPAARLASQQHRSAARRMHTILHACLASRAAPRFMLLAKDAATWLGPLLLTGFRWPSAGRPGAAPSPGLCFFL